MKKITKILTLGLVAGCMQLTVPAAHATNVEVHIKNLSTEAITTSASGFPTYLGPGQSQSVFLSFTNSTSNVNVTYKSASGKTCRFTGSHKHYGGNTTKWDKNAVAIGGHKNCGAIQNVRKWSSPFHYRLGFHMTD